MALALMAAAPAFAADKTAAPGGEKTSASGLKSTIVAVSYTNFAGGQDFGSAKCPDFGDNYVTGGGVFGSGLNEQSVNSTYPEFNSSGGDYWNVYMNNNGGSDDSFTVYAVCRPFQ
ncbi:MAG: hypothetical protein NVSMB51_12780 [Solirubrobacteraceae bacterium]